MEMRRSAKRALSVRSLMKEVVELAFQDDPNDPLLLDRCTLLIDLAKDRDVFLPRRIPACQQSIRSACSWESPRGHTV